MNKLASIFAPLVLASSLLLPAVAQQEVNPDYYPPVPDATVQQPHKAGSAPASEQKPATKSHLTPVSYHSDAHVAGQKPAAHAAKRQHKNVSAK